MTSISLPDDVVARLKKRAAARGLSLAEYLAQHANEPPLDPPGTPGERAAAWDRLLARMREIGERLPPGHVVDDSRESIYGLRA